MCLIMSQIFSSHRRSLVCVNFAWLLSIRDNSFQSSSLWITTGSFLGKAGCWFCSYSFQLPQKLNCGHNQDLNRLGNALEASSECFARVNVFFSCSPFYLPKILWTFSISSLLSHFLLCLLLAAVKRCDWASLGRDDVTDVEHCVPV